MQHKPQPPIISLTRRRLLQGTLSSTVGLVAWYQGWPRLRGYPEIGLGKTLDLLES